jgi:hypothetical protein
MLRQFHLLVHHLHIYRPVWYYPGVIFDLIPVSFVIILSLQALFTLLWVVITKWVITGRQQDRCHAWDRSSYCQQWQLHLALAQFIYKGCSNGGMLAPITGTMYIMWYFCAKTA